MFNPHTLKEDFPIFSHDPDLVYLDSTATSLKPKSVIHKVAQYYQEYSANIHRGIYALSEKASEEFEETRKIVSLFIHASRPEEIIFTRNTTESINIIASTLGKQMLCEGDEIVVTIAEHHANFVPWQQLALEKKATFVCIALTDKEEVDVSTLHKYVTSKTRILAVPYVSNVLGIINPIQKIIAEAKKINPMIITVVDAAQAIPHLKVDVNALGCDFLAFSSHKMLGPTGVGILWGRYELLQSMPPYQFGGDMIQKVRCDSTIFKEPPYKFEAGTPAIAEVIGLKAAIEYLEYIGLDTIHEHEKNLRKYAVDQLRKNFGHDITIFGSSDETTMTGILTFTFAHIHPHDIAQVLDEHSIAIRAGHHCAQPLHAYLKIDATARASFYMYNTEEDVIKLVNALKEVQKIFNKR